MKVVYGVSPIGLGHATRAVAVGSLLQAAGHDVTFASGGPAAEFLESYDLKVSGAVRAPVPAVVGGEMKRAALWYLRYWAGYRSTRRRMEELITDAAPDLVVGDEEFASVQVAIERHVPTALMADELELGFAKSWLASRVERRVDRWYRALQKQVPLIMMPELGEDSGNVKHVSPVVRKPTMGPREARARFGLPDGGRMVLFSMSGSGVGRYFLSAALKAFASAKLEGAFMAVSGNRGAKVAGKDVYDLGVVRDNQDLVAAADLVVSTAGKSTIDEAASSGTPIVAIPIRGHAEQERNAAALGFSFDDVERLGELFRERVGRRTAAANYDGAAEAARLLEGLPRRAG